jgi:hypothetical protein
MIAGVDSRAMVRRLGRGALMPVAAVLVHQLRFTLAFGGHARVELARQGHAYLHSLVPWIVLLIGVAVGAFLWALGRTLGGQRSRSRYTLSLAGLWIVCSGCLVAIYVVQELLEGLFATGHPLGGRYRWRCVSGSCWRRSSTAPAGCSTKLPGAGAHTRGLDPLAEGLRLGGAMLCSPRSRRWLTVGPAAVRRAEIPRE